MTITPHQKGFSLELRIKTMNGVMYQSTDLREYIYITAPELWLTEHHRRHRKIERDRQPRICYEPVSPKYGCLNKIRRLPMKTDMSSVKGQNFVWSHNLDKEIQKIITARRRTSLL